MAFDFGAAIGPAITGGLSFLGQKKANSDTLKSARESMAFTERMSNTSYQRAMADMRAAGLNPMLAFMKGGASTPTGTSANMQNELGVGASSAMDMKRLNADYDKIRMDTELSKSMIAAQQADALLKKATTAKTIAEAKRLGFTMKEDEFYSKLFGEGSGAIDWSIDFRNRSGELLKKGAHHVKDSTTRAVDWFRNPDFSEANRRLKEMKDRGKKK